MHVVACSETSYRERERERERARERERQTERKRERARERERERERVRVRVTVRARAHTHTHTPGRLEEIHDLTDRVPPYTHTCIQMYVLSSKTHTYMHTWQRRDTHIHGRQAEIHTYMHKHTYTHIPIPMTHTWQARRDTRPHRPGSRCRVF